MIKEDKSVTVRMSKELHNKCIKLAIKRSVKENKIIKISEVIREILEKYNEL